MIPFSSRLGSAFLATEVYSDCGPQLLIFEAEHTLEQG